MSKNQHGKSGLPVHASLAVRQARYAQIVQMHDSDGLTFADIAAALSPPITPERARQIYAAGPPQRRPGRPWPKH